MAIILTGMHRSGTSMFARFLHETGIRMGENFYIDKTANRYGHFEDMDFLNLQRRELSRHFKGEDWLIYDDFSLSDEFSEKATALYQAKALGYKAEAWGWKDPRTTLFLDYWLDVDPEIKTIFMVRHPEQVLNSLCRLLKTRWSQKEKTKYLKTYTHYNKAILDFTQKHKNQNLAIVSMSRLINNPQEVLENVNEKIQTNLDFGLFSSLFDINAISSDAFIPSIFIGKQLDDARSVYEALKHYFV